LSLLHARLICISWSSGNPYPIPTCAPESSTLNQVALQSKTIALLTVLRWSRLCFLCVYSSPCTLYHRISTLPRQTSRHSLPSNLDLLPRDLKTALSPHRHPAPIFVNLSATHTLLYKALIHEDLHQELPTPSAKHTSTNKQSRQLGLSKLQESWVVVSYISRHVNTL
jgi:hypothetical protein